MYIQIFAKDALVECWHFFSYLAIIKETHWGKYIKTGLKVTDILVHYPAGQVVNIIIDIINANIIISFEINIYFDTF